MPCGALPTGRLASLPSLSHERAFQPAVSACRTGAPVATATASSARSALATWRGCCGRATRRSETGVDGGWQGARLRDGRFDTPTPPPSPPRHARRVVCRLEELKEPLQQTGYDEIGACTAQAGSPRLGGDALALRLEELAVHSALPCPPPPHTHTRAHKLAFASLRGAAGHGASHAAGRGVGAGAADARGAGDQHARGNDQVGGVSAGCCVPEAALHVCASAGGARSGGWVDPRPRPPRCSNYAVWLLRMLTSCEIKRRADFFAPFVMVRGRQRRCAGCVGSSHAAGARLSGACLRLCATPLAGPGRL